MSDVGQDSLSLVSQSMELDVHFIQRNIRDLAKTAQFSRLPELEELQNLAYNNLKTHMAPGKPLAEDPTLALEAWKTVSGMMMQVVETKRRAADTLLKARTIIDSPYIESGREDVFDDEDIPEEALDEASLSETGVFGKLGVKSGSDPDVVM